MPDIEKLINDLKDIERGFLDMAVQLRESDPGISYTASSISQTAMTAAEMIRKLIPEEIELEGGHTTWWYVCPECHGQVDQKDSFCKHCGQAIKP